MTEKLKQQLKEQMQFIPKESQEVIDSFDWIRISEEIGRKYFLGDKDIDMFQANVGLVLAGLEEQEELASYIEEDIAVSGKNAEKMTEEVVEKILKPIYEKLSEKIKAGIKNKSAYWQQNLHFILSGGDYTAFIREPDEKKEEAKEQPSFTPSKIDDLKSKFTI